MNRRVSLCTGGLIVSTLNAQDETSARKTVQSAHPRGRSSSGHKDLEGIGWSTKKAWWNPPCRRAESARALPARVSLL